MPRRCAGVVSSAAAMASCCLLILLFDGLRHWPSSWCCAAVRLQMGYNLLYGLQKASYDADCSLFLNILKEEVKVLAACCRPAYEDDNSPVSAVKRSQLVDDRHTKLPASS